MISDLRARICIRVYVIVKNELATVSAGVGVKAEIENTSEKQKVAILELNAVIVKRPRGGGGGSWI
jgi:hypothetical protein